MEKGPSALIFCVLLILGSCLCFGQITIRPGTALGFSSERPTIVIDAAGNIVTNGAGLGAADVHLNILSGLTVTGDLLVSKLRLINGNLDVNNTLTVAQTIEFGSGNVIQGTTGKIIFSGASSDLIGASGESFIDGALYQSGGGQKVYPVGSGSLYVPVTFDNIATADEIGVHVIEQDPALTFNPEEILTVENSHYWEILAASPSSIEAINSRVSLSLSGALPVSEGAYAVLNAESTGSAAINLKYSSVDDRQIASSGTVTKPILALGTIKEIIVKVRDLITPFLPDGENDKLYIEQIEAFDHRTVTMLDRWGGVVKRWDNFTNEVDYDFSKLSPGNYIVVVEYGNLAEGTSLEKVSQMVTVLKTN